MIEKFENNVNNHEFNESHPDFKIALKICCAMFHEDFFNPRNGNFSNHTYMSVCRTITLSLKKYGLEAFYYIESDCFEKNYDIFGKVEFSPRLLLNFFKEKKEEIHKFKRKKFEEKKEEIEIQENKTNLIPIHTLIPEIFDDTKRAIPNVFLRSALFGVIKPGRRYFVKNQKIQSMSQYSVYYTGEQLDQNDLEVWDSITFIAKNNESTQFLKTSIYEICKFMGYSKDKKNREAVRSRIKRLKAGAVEINYDKKFYFGSLIDDFSYDEEDGKVVIRFNKKLLSLFESGDYTLVNKKIKGYLGENQLASWLFHFYETHENPIPFKLEYLKKLSQCESTSKEFKRMLKTSLQKIKVAYDINGFTLNYQLNDDTLHVSKLLI